jgi:hypothetical protein
MTATSADPPVRLQPLTFLAAGDDVVVGRTDVDAYAVFPRDGAELLRRLSEGVPPGEAAAWYEHAHGEPLDVDDFLATLAELGFLRTAETPAALERPLRWQRLGRAVYSLPACLLYALITAATLAVCLRDPVLAPHRDHVFFTSYLVIVEVAVAVGQVPLLLLHEVAHALAGRRLGLRTRIRIGHRLYLLVFETVMDGLVIVPRRRRYLPMLAGMLCDLLLACLLTLCAWLLQRRDGSFPVAAGVCLALAFTTLPRIAMEFLLFLRTDVYYLVVTLFGCVDLQRTSKGLAVDVWWRLLRRPDRRPDRTQWHPNDVRVARVYAPFLVAGYGVALALLAGVLLPITWRFATTAAVAAATLDLTSTHFWDAAGLLALNIAQPAAALLLKLRDSQR